MLAILILTPVLSLHAEAQTENSNTDFKSIENISDTVQEKTPGFIKKPFVFVFNSLENFRTEWLEKIKARQAETKSKLDQAPEEETTPDEELVGEIGNEEASGMWHELKNTFKYLEIFILSLLILIFSVKLIFYGFLIFIILTVVRFFWFQIY